MKVYAPPELNSPTRFRSQAAFAIPLNLNQNALRRHRLDGFVYPALQIPANDEREELPKDFPSDRPYSRTDWVNCLGAPAVVVPGGFYANGLPFGVEMSADYGKDGELLGIAYAFEQATHLRRAPTE